MKIHWEILRLFTFALLIAFSVSGFAFVNYDEWEGDVSSDWNDANNWEGNSLPATNQAARVNGPSTYTNAPVIGSNSTFTPRFLVVRDTGLLAINASLSLSRSAFIGAQAILTINTGGTLTTTGTRDLNIRNENTVVNVTGGNLNIGDDILIDRFLDLVPGADPTLNVTGGTVIVGDDIRFDGAIAEQPTLIVNGGTVDVGGSLYNDGADVNLYILSDSLIIRGNITMDDTDDSLSMSGGVLLMLGDGGTFTNAGTINGTGGSIIFEEDYTFDGAGTSNIYNLVISPTTGGLDQSVTSMGIAGDFSNSGSFVSNSNEVLFNGSGNQAINGGADFFDVTVNKTGGELTLNSDISITSGGNLTLTQGILNSDSTNTLTINDAASSTSGDADSYVDGYMRKIGNDDFIFPLGNAGIWSRIEMSSATGSADTDVFGAEYLRGTHPESFWDSLSYGGDPGGMYNVSILDYWKLYRINGSAQPFVKLYWESGDSAQIDDLADLVVGHYTGSNTWEDLGGTTTGTVSSGSVETSARVTSFSPFTFGSSSSTSNPLPITLLNFGAQSTGDLVEIKWSTASEINNDFFEIERSIDGTNFHSIEKIEGAGNSDVILHYSSADYEPIINQYSYYRLRQTDFDGAVSYSNIDVVFVNQSEQSKILVFPNPVRGDQVFLNITKNEEQGIAVFMFDQLGNQVSEVRFDNNDDGLYAVNVPEIKGMYILKVVTSTQSYTNRIIVE